MDDEGLFLPTLLLTVPLFSVPPTCLFDSFLVNATFLDIYPQKPGAQRPSFDTRYLNE